ncbi:MAG: hypothetical protein GWN87_01205, partial [Desulfuromonadales bacterium]|nr:hypothetical protein [Desulfuromonadales bacterium]
AIPLELGSRLPVALDEYLVTALPPVAVENKFRTIGLALPKDEIASIVNPFDEQQLPLRYLGVEPFSYAGRLNTQPPDCLLL